MAATENDIGYLPGEHERNNVITYLEEHRRDFPQRVALRWVEGETLAAWDGGVEAPFPHREISYGQLVTLIRRTAAGLHRLGIRKGDRVIIFLPMGVGMYTAMFAVQRLGAIAVFLDSWARRSHLGASAACVTPKAMISHKLAFDLVQQVPEFAPMPLRILGGPGDGQFSARLEDLMQTPDDAPVCAVAGDHPALITFTTGSSGTPKGANRTHRFLSAQHRALSRVLPYTPTDTDMPAFPIFSLNNLASGVTTILPALDLARPSDRDSSALAAQIVHDAITCATLSPSMFTNLARFCADSGLQLPSLRRVVTGGAPVSRDNVRDFRAVAPNAQAWILYGSTEVEPMAHIEGQEMLALAVDPDPEVVEEGVNVGHVSPELECKFIRIVRGPIDLAVTPWTELELPRGAIGEFLVTGDHVCHDYYNNEEAFARAKIRDADGRVWHRTGDLAYLDPDGYLRMVGRIHNVIERDGRYYFPVRAEVILRRLPFVRQAAFVGMPDDELGMRNAVVVALDRAAVDPARALQETERLFAKNRIPIDSFYVVDEVPLDPRHHSKVEYAVLRAHLLDAGVPDLKAAES